MADCTSLTQAQLVKRLADGFTALLKLVEELRSHNEEVQKLMGHEHQKPSATKASERRDQESSINNGVEALNLLRIRERNAQPEGLEQGANDQEQALMPEEHPFINLKGPQKMVCPFASMAKECAAEQRPSQLASPQRPDSLPTPPDTREQYIDDHEARLADKEQKLRTPSVTGSFSKCPIRMLDERPPEEIAEYFETHKHEIPRSHEICVKRYQSNEQSIRQLDAKYGNLVNMIQGLGMKHQPMLHSKDEVDGDTKPGGKVDKWANQIKPAPEDTEIASRMEGNPAALAERERYFDRPLKDIRVGESPTRPWGISVPAGTAQLEDDLPGDQTPGPMPVLQDSTLPTNINMRASNKQASEMVGDKPQVIFNGPVFIGYPPEQAAVFLKQSGMRE